jgi:hypothetical protein
VLLPSPAAKSCPQHSHLIELSAGVLQRFLISPSFQFLLKATLKRLNHSTILKYLEGRGITSQGHLYTV